MYHICNKIEMFLGHNKKFIDSDDKSKVMALQNIQIFINIVLPKVSVRLHFLVYNNIGMV